MTIPVADKDLTLTLIVWNADAERDKERGSVCSALPQHLVNTYPLRAVFDNGTAK